MIVIRLPKATGKEAEGLHYDLLLWADIELGLAIFTASAAALRPLLRHIPVVWDSYVRSRTLSRKARTSVAVGPYREVGAGSVEMGVMDDDADRSSKHAAEIPVLRPVHMETVSMDS